MEITNSDLIAGLALLVSVLSAYYSKRQGDFSRISYKNEYRAHLSENHEKYCTLLREVEDRHRAEYSNLSKSAGDALDHIVHLFDQYDIDRRSPRPLRHLIHESSEMLYYAFKGQLAWQYGLNICSRLGRIVSIEDRIEPSEDFFDGDHRRLFEQRYHNDPNAYEETALLQDKYFCCLVEQLRARLDPEKRVVLLTDVMASLKQVREKIDTLRPTFSDSAKGIEYAMASNAHEEFKLHESPELKKRLEYEMRRLDTLSELWLMDIDEEYLDRYCNYVSLCIYFCMILHIVQGVHSWGWHSPHRK